MSSSRTAATIGGDDRLCRGERSVAGGDGGDAALRVVRRRGFAHQHPRARRFGKQRRRDDPTLGRRRRRRPPTFRPPRRAPAAQRYGAHLAVAAGLEDQEVERIASRRQVEAAGELEAGAVDRLPVPLEVEVDPLGEESGDGAPGVEGVDVDLKRGATPASRRAGRRRRSRRRGAPGPSGRAGQGQGDGGDSTSPASWPASSRATRSGRRPLKGREPRAKSTRWARAPGGEAAASRAVAGRPRPRPCDRSAPGARPGICSGPCHSPVSGPLSGPSG